MILRGLGVASALMFAAGVVAGSANADPAFSNTLLIATWSPPPGFTAQPYANSTGTSEPAIAFGSDGAMAVDGLAWLPRQVNLWKGHFGDTPPAFFGGMDRSISVVGSGRIGRGGFDADVEFTSARTLLLADIDLVFNRPLNSFQVGVSVTRCPVMATGPGDCTTAILDQAQADRPWITTNGTSAWVSYYDSGQSALIRVQRSTDDGRTWTQVGSPIPGQGRATGDATFNQDIGPIVADPTTGNLYEGYAAGEPSVQKGTTSDFNNIYVSRSTDGGETWTAHLVYHAPLFTDLANFFQPLAVDPTNGTLYTAWTDRHGVWASSSSDQGEHWSMPLKVSNAQTTMMPWVAARKGKVDVVYYGTNAASADDPAAIWNVYDSQFMSGAWSVAQVSNTPNRIGGICLEGIECGRLDFGLLDLFEVAEDPVSGKAAVVYTDTTVGTWTFNGVTHELPEIVLAYEQ